MCFKFDKLPFNPMDSVDKYRQAAHGCEKKKELMVWTFNMLWDHWCCTDGKDSIPLRALEGKISGWGGKSLTDLFIFKKSLRDVLYKRMEELNWDLETKSQFRTWTESVAAVRAKFGTIEEPVIQLEGAGAHADRVLPAAWPASADKLLLIME